MVEPLPRARLSEPSIQMKLGLRTTPSPYKESLYRFLPSPGAVVDLGPVALASYAFMLSYLYGEYPPSAHVRIWT